MSEVLTELVQMSNELGRPDKPFAILGEGNTSARIDDSAFYVKASGTTLATITAGDFLPVSIPKVTAILNDANAGDDEVDQVLRDSVTAEGEKRKPSVETMLHAALYEYPEIMFIGHTHPIATNALLCSKNAREASMGRVCPDHIVVMGHKSVYIPYVDPGLVLARTVRDEVRKFVDAEGVVPKALMLENHGLFALGRSWKQVLNIHEMAEKCSQIVMGSYAVGGPSFLSDDDIRRIDTRPDEKYRQQMIKA